MTGLEFGLLLIGALLVAASFFMTKKFSDSDIDELNADPSLKITYHDSGKTVKRSRWCD